GGHAVVAAVDLRLQPLPGLRVQSLPRLRLVLRAAVTDVAEGELDGPPWVEPLQVLELTERLDRLEQVVGPALDREDRHLPAGLLGLPALVLVVGGAELGQAPAELADDRILDAGHVVGLARGSARLPGRDVDR